MFIYRMKMRLQHEDESKKRRISEICDASIGIKPLVTRFFSKKYAYGVNWYHHNSQPTLFIPFGKRLGTDSGVPLDYLNENYPRATLASALISIPAQLFYDIFWAVTYCLIAIPSLFAAAGFAIHAGLTHNENSEGIAYTALGNIVCALYFLLAIVIDLSREVLALATRTYATITESSAGREQDHWYADHAQFKPANA